MSRYEFAPDGTGPCAKAVVNAVLVMPNGTEYASSNFCHNPQTTCPRETYGYGAGDGYHLCQEVCDQQAHAEVNVINWATFNEGRNEHGGRIEKPLAGAKIYVDYTWICDNCGGEATKAGCTVHKGKPPEENVHAQRQWGAYQQSRKAILGL